MYYTQVPLTWGVPWRTALVSLGRRESGMTDYYYYGGGGGMTWPRALKYSQSLSSGGDKLHGKHLTLSEYGVGW